MFCQQLLITLWQNTTRSYPRWVFRSDTGHQVATELCTDCREAQPVVPVEWATSAGGGNKCKHCTPLCLTSITLISFRIVKLEAKCLSVSIQTPCKYSWEVVYRKLYRILRQATKLGGSPRPPRGFLTFLYMRPLFFTENLLILQFYIYIQFDNMKTNNIPISNCVRATDPLY
jgi:hypothetical protein